MHGHRSPANTTTLLTGLMEVCGAATEGPRSNWPELALPHKVNTGEKAINAPPHHTNHSTNGSLKVSTMSVSVTLVFLVEEPPVSNSIALMSDWAHQTMQSYSQAHKETVITLC